MKKNYILIYLLTLSIFTYAQSYQFGLVHNSGHNFKVVAIPDFTSAGNTDASDIGFALVLPSGSIDVINENSMLAGRTWTVQEFDAAFLTGLGLGDGSKDVFLFNNPPGQSLISHNSGDQIDLVSFDISNAPITDEIYFLLNSDPIALGAGTVLDSFYNSNIDNTSTQDYFSGIASGLESFMFSTLTVDDIEILSNNISLYPNPANNLVHIKTDDSIIIESVELYEVSGKRIQIGISDVNTLNVSNVSEGVYLLKIYTNKETLTKKLIVKK